MCQLRELRPSFHTGAEHNPVTFVRNSSTLSLSATATTADENGQHICTYSYTRPRSGNTHILVSGEGGEIFLEKTGDWNLESFGVTERTPSPSPSHQSSVSRSSQEFFARTRVSYSGKRPQLSRSKAQIQWCWCWCWCRCACVRKGRNRMACIESTYRD